MEIEQELALIRKNGAAVPPAVPPVPAIKPGYDDLEEPETGLPAPPDTGAGFWDVAGASWTSETIRTDSWTYRQRQRQELAQRMFDLLPDVDKQAVAAKPWSEGRGGWAGVEDEVVRRAAALASSSPEAAATWAGYPLTLDAFDREIDIARRRDLDEAQAVLDQPGGGIAEFLGGGARAMTDEASLALLPLGGFAGGVLRTIASEAALGFLSEAAVLPREFQVAEELGLPDPDIAARLALGAAFGAALPASFFGVQKGVEWYRARRAGLSAATPTGADPVEFEAGVEVAERAMRGEDTPEMAIGPDARREGTLGAILAEDAPGVLPPVGPDAPENWVAIRNGIFAGESGGDYNALFGYQNRKGGKFSRVRVTEMTVDQAIAFSDPRGAYGQWVKTQVGRVATPMGAYQIVGTTLRAAKKALGLQGDELMTPALQERLAHWIYREQGTGAWEGYRGPRASFTPSAAEGDAPNLGPTSRGYTGTGQVRAGDEFTVDVQYEVVDLSSLVRASGDMQPRDRSRIASDAWIADTAARLDPAQLMTSPTADRGAPIVGPDSVIESGNGRFGAIARAYERHPDRAMAYRRQIEAEGFAIPEGVDRPILVARRTSELTAEERPRFAIAAQDSGVAVMTPTEMARASSRAMSGPILARLDPARPLTDAANGEFVRSVLQGLPRSARNAMYGDDGMLNALGAKQLREALFARAWPDQSIIARHTEGDPGELKSLLEALDAAAPAWAALKADIEAGLVRPEMDISGHVLDAMRLIGAARDVAAKQGMPIATAIKELLDEVDLLEGAVAPLTVALVRKFWTNGRAARAEDVAAFLSRYAEDARKAGAAGGLFDGPGPRDVLVAIDKGAFGDLPEDLGRVRGSVTAQDQAKIDAIASQPIEGFDAGAAAPEAQAVRDEIRAELEASNQPENGPFGPIFTGLEDQPEAAIAKLMNEQDGEVPDAYIHPKLGPIAFVFGKLHPDNPQKDYGLVHILDKHGQSALDRLPEALRKGVVSTPFNGRITIDLPGDPPFRAVVKLEFNKVQKIWVVTGHDRPSDYKSRQVRTTDGPPASASPRVPDATGSLENRASIELDQAEVADPPTAMAEDIAKARAEIDALRGAGMDDLEIDLPDGTSAPLSRVLDDLDADDAFDAFIQACAITPAGGAQ